MFEDLIEKQDEVAGECEKDCDKCDSSCDIDTYTCIGCDRELKRGETCPTCHRKDLVQTDGY